MLIRVAVELCELIPEYECRVYVITTKDEMMEEIADDGTSVSHNMFSTTFHAMVSDFYRKFPTVTCTYWWAISLVRY